MIEKNSEVISNRELTPGTFFMTLRSREIVRYAHPGQFVMVRVRDGLDPILRRPFSIAGVGEDGLLLLLYRVVGKGTAIMAGREPGEQLSVLGPLGMGFELPGAGVDSVLVAGGVGAAPLLFMAQTLGKKELPFRLMMGFGSENEILSLDAFMGDPIEPAIATDDGSSGHHGLVTDLLRDFLEDLDVGHRAPEIYSCGPGPMLKSVASIGKEKNLKCQVSMEAMMACGLGACLGCAVKTGQGETPEYLHVCRDGPVFPAEAIDWAEY